MSDGWISFSQILLAAVIAWATVFYARRTKDMVDLMVQREAAAESEARIARVEALAGASLEAAGYGGWMVEAQHRGLHTWRKFLPEPAAQTEIVLVAWRQLSAAVIAAARALERIRYNDSDLAKPAADHFALVVQLQLRASEGRVEEMSGLVERIRSSADELWQRVSS